MINKCNLVTFTYLFYSTSLHDINVKKTVVYHLVNGSMVLLSTENSKNGRLKVILLVAV